MSLNKYRYIYNYYINLIKTENTVLNTEQSCPSKHESMRPIIWNATRDVSCWYAQQINSTLLEMTILFIPEIGTFNCVLDMRHESSCFRQLQGTNRPWVAGTKTMANYWNSKIDVFETMSLTTNKTDTRSVWGEVWNLWYFLSSVRAEPKEERSTAEPRLLLNGPNLF